MGSDLDHGKEGLNQANHWRAKPASRQHGIFAVDDFVARRTAELVAQGVKETVAACQARGEAHMEAFKPEDFLESAGGGILKSHPYNIKLALRRLRVNVGLNEFSTETEIAGLDRYGPELTDAGAIRLRFLIQETFGFLPPGTVFDEVLVDVAHQNRFHPVRDWLDGLQWDGKRRVDTWLSVYGGAENTEFARAVARLFLTAGVRRVRQPGVKFDTMPVLESPQGRDKSKALRTLAIKDQWFTDNLPLSADPKEVIEQTRGVWIAEFAELSGLGKRDINHVKNFLSKQEDRARPAYGRRSERAPRQFIAAGTTNDQEYLIDNENRRFWPVTITQFDTPALARDAEQLWAEAAHYEAKGESIVLDSRLWQIAAEEQSEREIENPFAPVLSEKLGSRKGWVTSRRVWEIVNIPLERRAQVARQVGAAMHKQGFERHRIRSNTDPRGNRGDYVFERGKGEAEI